MHCTEALFLAITGVYRTSLDSINKSDINPQRRDFKL